MNKIAIAVLIIIIVLIGIWYIYPTGASGYSDYEFDDGFVSGIIRLYFSFKDSNGEMHDLIGGSIDSTSPFSFIYDGTYFTNLYVKIDMKIYEETVSYDSITFSDYSLMDSDIILYANPDIGYPFMNIKQPWSSVPDITIPIDGEYHPFIIYEVPLILPDGSELPNRNLFFRYEFEGTLPYKINPNNIDNELIFYHSTNPAIIHFYFTKNNNSMSILR